MDTIDINRILYPIAAECTFFSTAHGTFSKIDHMLGHKANLNKYKKIEITFYILLDNNGIKLKITNKRNYRKCPNTFLNDMGIKRRNFKILRIKNENPTSMGHSKGSVKMKDFSHEYLHLKMREILCK
jgi:hypothetical protein